MWNDLENKIILYANNTILYAEIAHTSDRINADNVFKQQLIYNSIIMFNVGNITQSS